MAASARQSDVARAQGTSPALLGRWQRSALEQAVLSSAKCEVKLYEQESRIELVRSR